MNDVVFLGREKVPITKLSFGCIDEKVSAQLNVLHCFVLNIMIKSNTVCAGEINLLFSP